MSLLLDALKRSEQEREQTLKGRIGHAAPPPRAARTPVVWVVAVLALLGLNAALLAVWFAEPEPARPAPRTASVASNSRPMPEPAVRSLAMEAAMVADANDRKSRRAATRATPADAGPPSAPATTPAVTAQETVAATAPPTSSVSRAIPAGLPALHMQIHVYAADPAERFVMINMRSYGEGDRLAAGPTVLHIRPDGVVLGYHGRSFLLPRK